MPPYFILGFFNMKALALFGSTARCEREIDSDIDLLGVYNKNSIINSSESIVNLYLYPEKILIEKMKAGDLFALHLVKESLPIYGSECLSEIFSKFEYKENYTYEIGISLFISNIIINNYYSIPDKFLANKKLAWCLRTTIIAISAQDRNPIFSKKSLSEYLNLSNVSSQDILNSINSKRIKHQLPIEFIEIYKEIFEEISSRYRITSDFSKDPLVSDILIKLELLTSTKKKCPTLYS